MRSPFSIFRKYQKIAMVIILLLIMVAFTIGDALMQMSGDLPVILIVVMTAMIGASVGALVGIQTGKPSEYAIAGVAVGVIVALVASNLSGPAAAVETTAGNLSRHELDELVQRRLTANSFIVAVYQRVSPPPQESNPWFRDFWQNQLMRTQFSNGLYNPGDDSESSRPQLQEDVVLGYLLDREADEMGIEVSDEAVNNFIQSIRMFGFSNSERRLSLDDFKEIRTRMRLSESDLYDALRGELRVRMARQNLSPDFMPAPEDYWKIHRQLNVRQRLDVAAVPVDIMAKDLSDPDAEQIAAYFDQFKAIPPGYYGPGTPSFLQPRKVALAYLEAPYEQFKKQAGEVTDADIERYYQDNKETYKNNPFPDSKGPERDNPLDPEFFPDDGPALTPGTPPPADAPKASPDADKDAQGTADDAAKTPAVPEDSKDGDKKSQPQESPKSEAAPDDKKDQEGAGLERQSILGSGELLALYQPPGEKATPETSPAADGAKKEEASPAAQNSEPANSEKAADTPSDSAAPEGDGNAAGPVSAPKPGEQTPEPEYRPLDNDLRGQIRDQILRTRTIALMKEAIDRAVDEVQKWREKYITVDENGNPGISDEEIASNVKQYAQQQNLRYMETGLLSDAELRDSDANPIGSATDPLDLQMDPSSVRTVWQRLFMSHARQVFDPFVAESPLNSDRYAVWKTQDKEQHVPTLDEAGVNQQVITAWKQNEARPLAEKRANELADLVKAAKASMSKALAGQTVTGKPDGPVLTTQLTESFSWLRESSAPQPNPFERAPPQISEVSALKEIDERFMEVIFDQMSEGDVRAIPNRDRSIFYVVQVYERKPATPEDENAFRQAFLRENIFGGLGNTPYSYRIGMAQGRLRNQWVTELMQKYGVHWTEFERGAPGQ
ncbi:MAG: SurA N-terminal domain-containing protein [Planctomycetaceae bacterium]